MTVDEIRRSPYIKRARRIGARVTSALMVLGLTFLVGATRAAASEALQVQGGLIAAVPPDPNGVRSFRGIPFAAPPVGDLRWRPPQPVNAWQGERAAGPFGPRCMQSARLGDIDPLNPRMSEDCLYLNVWTPARAAADRLPVMVWIYGGSFNVGAGSEPWYDGTNLARKGVVVVTLNYRVDVFGFLSHPDLTSESDHLASGNYGLMDQIAALSWVRRNIAAFGGDPGLVTVFGESAGSLSVSTLMASPLGHGLFQRAIGQSGAMLYPDKSLFALPPLANAEKAGEELARVLSANSIAELREKPADALLEAVTKNSDVPRIVRGPNIDGYVLPGNAAAIFASGQATDVPLMAGSNADEGTLFAARARPRPTPESYTEQVHTFFGGAADAVLQVYPAGTPEEAKASFAALLGDQLISYPTWKWDELHARTAKAPTFRFLFELRPPAPALSLTPLAAPGVFHTAEITYVFDNLQVRDWPWRPQDRQMAEILSSYWVNFARSGNPNGAGLPDWPVYAGPDSAVMRLTEQPVAAPDPGLARYRVLDEFYSSKGQ